MSPSTYYYKNKIKIVMVQLSEKEKSVAISIVAAAEDSDVESFARSKSSLLDGLEIGKEIELAPAEELIHKKSFTDRKTEKTKSYFNCFAAIDGKTVEFAASRLNDSFNTESGLMYRVKNFASTKIACEELAGKTIRVVKKVITPKVNFVDGLPEESKTETRKVNLFEIVEAAK